MEVHGRCHCGRIAYEAEIDPSLVGICHCTDCQMLTGSVYRVSVPAIRESFRLKSGTPRIYVKTADSGTKRRHAFCGDCGTPVYAAADDDSPPAYSLRIGCLDRRAELLPQRRIWCRSQLAWSLDVAGVPGQSWRGCVFPSVGRMAGAAGVVCRSNGLEARSVPCSSRRRGERMLLTDGIFVLAVAAILSGLFATGTVAETKSVVETAPQGAGVPPAGVQAQPLAPKELNDPLPPSEMPRPAHPGVVTPRGVPQGMGNEVDLSKTPGDDDPSDGVDEPGRDPVPGLPRPAPGVNKP